MHNNYYFLKQLTPLLSEKILDLTFATCFSQNKNELILGFADENKEFYIRAVLNPEFCCLTFPENFARSKRNSVELFRDALDKKALSIQQFLNERSFAIHLEQEFTLLFKMHGNRANIILFKENEVHSIFRNNLKKDTLLDLSEIDRPINQDYQSFLDTGCKTELLFPTFDKVVKEYLDQNNFNKVSCEERWHLLHKTLQQLNASEFYISYFHSELIFSLLPIGNILHKLNDPIESVNLFYQIFSGSYYLQKEKDSILKILEKKLIQTQSYIKKSYQKLYELENNSRNEEVANIIMANLHNFIENKEEHELFDFYQNQPIKVKLARGLSPQKLAENYYRKAKNQKLEIRQLEENILAKESAVTQIKQQLQEIEKIDNIKSLRNFIKENNLLKVFKEEEETLPFKEILYEGYQILIGKNARSNDALIQNFAKKDDLWLHAKDSSGSHVVIKNKSGQNFPKQVIEKAAEIAAYHSKQKNDSLCPVIYTPRKWVRKIKGAAPGAVKVEKEKVILVKPAI